jgi:Retroviral aspartyl protease
MGHDPEMFSKTWLEGGLLPLQGGGMVRQASLAAADATVTSADAACADADAAHMTASTMCVVVKTKVCNSINNTCLIDGGATHSVLNIDWYEHQGIDWKSLFGMTDVQQCKGTMYMANEVPAEIHGQVDIGMELNDAKGKKFVQSFYLMRLGKHNYAQILGFDWQYKFHTRIALPEYTVEIRKLRCTVSGCPVPVRMYQLRSAVCSDSAMPKPTCDMVGPQELMKEVRLLSARLRRLHLYVPPEAFLRQIIIRPAVQADELQQTLQSKPLQWSVDDKLEARAAALRNRIEQTFRKEYADVLDSEPKGVNDKMPH